MSKKLFFGAAAALGAGIALYTTLRDREYTQQRENAPALTPLSSLISSQRNLDRADRASLRSWFLEETRGDSTGKRLRIMDMSPHALQTAGYYLDISLDTAHYLLCSVTESGSHQILAAALFNFTEIEPELQELLEAGGGIILVSGGSRAEGEHDVIHVEQLDFPTLGEIAAEKQSAEKDSPAL